MAKNKKMGEKDQSLNKNLKNKMTPISQKIPEDNKSLYNKINKGCGSSCSIKNSTIISFIIFFILGVIITYFLIIPVLNLATENAAKEDNIISKEVTVAEVEKKVLSFIAPQLPEGISASVKEVISKRGLYKMTIIIQEDGLEDGQKQEIVIYLTKDGTLLFLEVINLEEAKKEAEKRQEETEKRQGEEILNAEFQAALTPERKVKIAKCLTDKGFRVYVADWCPFCRQQKEFFGEAAKYLPSVDCYNPEGKRGNLGKCPGIEGVPLWKDGEGNKLTGGMIQIRVLVEKSGCDF